MNYGRAMILITKMYLIQTAQKRDSFIPESTAKRSVSVFQENARMIFVWDVILVVTVAVRLSVILILYVEMVNAKIPKKMGINVMKLKKNAK